jgi:hypothetical protein
MLRMSVTFMAVQWCTTCRCDQGFEQPVCDEGHGTDCPEWFCVECGHAVVLMTPRADQPAVTDRSAA